VIHVGEMRNAYKIFIIKPEEKIPLRKPRHRWDGSIKMDLSEICSRVWIGFIWLKLGRLL
jgi:hypothetical protein